MSHRLAYMTGEYPRATDTFIQREIAALRKLGFSVQPFAARSVDMSQILDRTARLERGATIYLLPANPFRLILAHASFLLKHFQRYISALSLAIRTRPPGIRGAFMQLAYFAESAILAKEMQRRNITHIHNHFTDSSCTVSMLASTLGGFTFSFTVHGPADFVNPAYWRLDEKIRRAYFVICISEYARQHVLELSGPGAREKLHVVHCGVDVNELTASGGGNGNHLVFIGRLAAAKGLPTLLRAVADIRQTRPSTTLTIIGNGPQRAELESLCQNLNLKETVAFRGYQPPQEVRRVLASADLFVMTSTAEGVPVVLMEAMACALPVIAPNIAGIPELVDHEQNGLLIPPDDSAATAAAIEKLLADPELRKRYGIAGRAKVQSQFNLDVEAEKIKGLLATAGIHPAQPPMLRSLLLISPCRDEAQYLRRAMDSVLAQSVLPTLWINIDDGSTDQTASILAEYAERYAFIKVISRPDRGFRQLGRGVIDSFYDGYNAVEASDFEFVVKLDLDIELPPEYFATLIRRMDQEPRLGTCSGKPHYIQSETGKIIQERCGNEQSVGMVKFYRTSCFMEIGGFVRELMWDGIDGHRCRMLGWIAESREEPELRFEHMRPMGSSDKGFWTGRMRHGYGQYFMGTGIPYLLASCLYRLFQPPIVIGSIALFWGYFQAALRHIPRYGDAEFRSFLRTYQWKCLVLGKTRATGELDQRTRMK